MKVAVSVEFGTFVYKLKALDGLRLKCYGAAFGTSRERPEIIEDTFPGGALRRRVVVEHDEQISDMELRSANTKCCGRNGVFGYFKVCLCERDDSVCDTMEFRVRLKIKCKPLCEEDPFLFDGVPMDESTECPQCEDAF